MMVDAENEDFLQDISFDYYGTRMAVCGSDRKIKIFEKNSRQEWEIMTTWEVS
jgi:nucleoporin SEH1